MDAKKGALAPDLSPLGLLLGALPPKLVADAMALAVERMNLDAEKLSLILVRALAPDLVLGETEEAKARGISPTTLRGMKERGDIPRVVNS